MACWPAHAHNADLKSRGGGFMARAGCCTSNCSVARACAGEAHEVLSDRSRRQELDQDLSMEERFSGADAYGGFGFGERHCGPGSRYGSGYPGYIPSRTGSGADFAERFRRAAQHRPQANSRAGFYGYGWAGF